MISFLNKIIFNTTVLSKKVETRFIISSGRTGTKFLEVFFNRCFSDIQAFHEPSPDFLELAVNKYHNNLSQKNCITFIKDSRRNYFKKAIKEGQKVYLESNPYLSFHIPQLRKVFPLSKMLFIVRSPATYLESAYSKSPDGSGKMFFYGENDHRQRLFASEISGDPFSSQWKNFDRLDKIAWWWNFCNTLIYEHSLNKPNSLVLKYEDLFGNERVEVINKIVDFFNVRKLLKVSEDEMLEALSIKSNTNPEKLLSLHIDLNSEKRDLINKITEKARILFQYPSI